jgi:membrane-associated protease RseP (regulator of RpoE activity)
MVDADAPAGKAGLKEHDVIVTYNNQTVEDVNQLRRMIRDTAPGSKVNLGISRDGKKMNVTAELSDRRKQWSSGERYIPLPPINIPPMPEIDVPSFSMLQYSRRSGLVVENITRQLGDYFGAKDGKGVLVRSVERNSPAETAGFKAGDVIIRVGSEPVENMSDWNQLMRSQQAGKVPVTVIREKHESTFTLSMPERRGDRSTNSWIGFDDLDDINIEIANIGPEIHKQMIDLQKQLNSAEFRKQMAEAQKTVKLQQKEMQKAMQKAQKDVEKAMRDLHNQKITIHIDDDEE